MINKAIIVGNLGSDPVSRAMPSGEEVANFSVATSKRWTDKQGQKKEATEWHKCAAFGKLAEICHQWLRKGSQVYVEGELRTRKWEKDGQDHYSTEIIVREMKMLGKKDGDSASGPPTGRGQLPPSGQSGAGAGAPGPDDYDDDIPF